MQHLKVSSKEAGFQLSFRVSKIEWGKERKAQAGVSDYLSPTVVSIMNSGHVFKEEMCN